MFVKDFSSLIKSGLVGVGRSTKDILTFTSKKNHNEITQKTKDIENLKINLETSLTKGREYELQKQQPTEQMATLSRQKTHLKKELALLSQSLETLGYGVAAWTQNRRFSVKCAHWSNMRPTCKYRPNQSILRLCTYQHRRNNSAFRANSAKTGIYLNSQSTHVAAVKRVLRVLGISLALPVFIWLPLGLIPSIPSIIDVFGVTGLKVPSSIVIGGLLLAAIGFEDF